VAEMVAMAAGTRIRVDLEFRRADGSVPVRAQTTNLRVDPEAMRGRGRRENQRAEKRGYRCVAHKQLTPERVTAYSGEFPEDKVHFEPEVARSIETMQLLAREPVLIGVSIFYLTPGSPIAESFPEMAGEDIFRSRSTAMAIETEHCKRGDWMMWYLDKINRYWETQLNKKTGKELRSLLERVEDKDCVSLLENGKKIKKCDLCKQDDYDDYHAYDNIFGEKLCKRIKEPALKIADFLRTVYPRIPLCVSEDPAKKS